MTLLGRLDSQPPDPYYGDNTSTGTLYNGIWGYAAGSREYALQSNSFGLHIIDVTDPAVPFRVQFIDMSGGVSPPKGRIWRDADIHQDPVSGVGGAELSPPRPGDKQLLLSRDDRVNPVRQQLGPTNRCPCLVATPGVRDLWGAREERRVTIEMGHMQAKEARLSPAGWLLWSTWKRPAPSR